MRFIPAILIVFLLWGCVGADGKVYRPLVVESNAEKQSFVPEGSMIVPEGYEEEQFKNGVQWACLYASVSFLRKQGFPKAIIPDMAATNCTGFDDEVWDSYQRIEQRKEVEKSTSEMFEELGIPLESS
jgi:hypothetical protein